MARKYPFSFLSIFKGSALRLSIRTFVSNEEESIDAATGCLTKLPHDTSNTHLRKIAERVYPGAHYKQDAKRCAGLHNHHLVICVARTRPTCISKRLLEQHDVALGIELGITVPSNERLHWFVFFRYTPRRALVAYPVAISTVVARGQLPACARTTSQARFENRQAKSPPSERQVSPTLVMKAGIAGGSQLRSRLLLVGMSPFGCPHGPLLDYTARLYNTAVTRPVQMKNLAQIVDVRSQ